MKNFFYPTYNILPLYLFFSLLFFLPSMHLFFPCTFSLSLILSALGYLIRWDTRRKIQLSRHFNGFFGVNVGKSLILKGFFRRDNVENGALFFFRFSSFSRCRGYVLDFVHIFWRVLGVIIASGAGADPSLSRGGRAWA